MRHSDCGVTLGKNRKILPNARTKCSDTSMQIMPMMISDVNNNRVDNRNGKMSQLREAIHLYKDL